MTCPRCQQQSPPDGDFYPHCGATLAAVCVHFGTKPGKRADIIAVRTRSPRLLPWHDPEANLVYAARGSDVRTTVVDGEVLLDDFAPVRVDRSDVIAEARSAAHELAKRAGV